jgi:hypothetical protein
MVAIANQLQPKLDPRYITSIEERVFIEGPQRRVADVWIQKVRGAEGMAPLAESDSDTAVVVEVATWKFTRPGSKSSIRTTS